jgi:hypothetical protein
MELAPEFCTLSPSQSQGELKRVETLMPQWFSTRAKYFLHGRIQLYTPWLVKTVTLKAMVFFLNN